MKLIYTVQQYFCEWIFTFLLCSRSFFFFALCAECAHSTKDDSVHITFSICCKSYCYDSWKSQSMVWNLQLCMILFNTARSTSVDEAALLGSLPAHWVTKAIEFNYLAKLNILCLHIQKNLAWCDRVSFMREQKRETKVIESVKSWDEKCKREKSASKKR